MKFEYLVRLDALSSPGLTSNYEAPVSVEEDAAMPGFARVRIRGTGAESWAEFLGPGGRLRRDLIKAKLANLLAAATKPGKEIIFKRNNISFVELKNIYMYIENDKNKILKKLVAH